jgi:phage gp45-like
MGCAVDSGDGSGGATGDDGEESVSETEDALLTCKPPVISANHGHKLTVPAADVTAHVTKTYSIKGTSGHDHLVTITAAQFAQLGAGHAITVASTNSAGHTHSVTVTCSVSAPPPPPAGTCSRGASATTISANHGHSLTVSKADVAAATAKTYSIKGTSSHAHQITITAAQFGQLKSGRTVSVTSSLVLSHVHTVTVACA